MKKSNRKGTAGGAENSLGARGSALSEESRRLWQQIGALFHRLSTEQQLAVHRILFGDSGLESPSELLEKRVSEMHLQLAENAWAERVAMYQHKISQKRRPTKRTRKLARMVEKFKKLSPKLTWREIVTRIEIEAPGTFDSLDDMKARIEKARKAFNRVILKKAN